MFLRSLLNKSSMVERERALPGREAPIPTSETHEVLGTPIKGPFPEGIETAYFGLGCFWGAERSFWELDGVYTTAVGYQGGYTPNPTYEETCTGRTGHTEVVLVAYDPNTISYDALLKHFWESHDPTQGMRQGNDVGSQYRSAVYTASEAQAELAAASRERYQGALKASGRDNQITTEIAAAGEFFYAEPYHQQYLHKVPNGYCNLGGVGVSCPVGLTTAS